RLLRHHDVRTTTTIYGRLDVEDLRAALEKLPQLGAREVHRGGRRAEESWHSAMPLAFWPAHQLDSRVLRGLMTPDRLRVVIVDDSPMARTAMRQTLQAGSRRTYEIEELASGTAAIVLCRERPPDCVILDHYLPDVDAPEVLEALRAPGGGMPCPVVVLTDTAGSELSAAVLGAGAQDYLAKGSVTPQTLARAVENAIERWKMAVS